MYHEYIKSEFPLLSCDNQTRNNKLNFDVPMAETLGINSVK